jgi:hypothetical protein
MTKEIPLFPELPEEPKVEETLPKPVVEETPKPVVKKEEEKPAQKDILFLGIAVSIVGIIVLLIVAGIGFTRLSSRLAELNDKVKANSDGLAVLEGSVYQVITAQTAANQAITKLQDSVTTLNGSVDKLSIDTQKSIAEVKDIANEAKAAANNAASKASKNAKYSVCISKKRMTLDPVTNKLRYSSQAIEACRKSAGL